MESNTSSIITATISVGGSALVLVVGHWLSQGDRLARTQRMIDKSSSEANAKIRDELWDELRTLREENKRFAEVKIALGILEAQMKSLQEDFDREKALRIAAETERNAVRVEMNALKETLIRQERRNN